ncbi:O-glucosyltransferase [Canna indica]|uniref:O-glucosyltransferase n=1 Tax=Canna indica TaxID=4628 RepID=A0AAQ3QRS4_9LILI|nr:O-glucosyltransferase [Canna indica]
MKPWPSESCGSDDQEQLVEASPVVISKAKSSVLTASWSSATKGVAVVFLALFALVFFTSVRWIDGVPLALTKSGSAQALESNSPVTLTCGGNKSTCRASTTSRPPSPSLDDVASPSPSSCPDYFRWMHEDLRPWESAGITRELVSGARRFATFRLVILGGRVYVEKYRPAFQTRDVFTLWGILQLVSRYPGRVPDLDLMFNCDDTPVVKSAAYSSSPPPLVFRYCKNDETLDIVFPDWTFWGWSEINLKPWERMTEELKKGNERVKWRKRKPFAYWKGNPWVSDSRRDLIKCNVSKQQDWNARLFAQNWDSEARGGFKNSDMAAQCDYRYKIYVEGRAWSVSQKYILACNSPALFVTTHFHDFFSRGLVPGLHYWPIKEHSKCRSIKFAVDWGNKHQKEAEEMGKAGSRFVQEELKMERVYDYMLHLLIQYAKLLKYKPSIPEKSTELCSESMACPATGVAKKFLMESMVQSTRAAEPCELPPPFEAAELRGMLERKADAIKQVELWEKKG